MKKITCMVSGLLVFFITVSFAVPAPPVSRRMSTITSMSIKYDLVKTFLHIEAVHPSDNWEIDYVRMMTISLNGQDVSTQNYYHQTSAEDFTDDVPLKAQAGDVIKVTLFCTGGSSSAEELTVTDQAGGQPDQSTDVVTDNGTTDNTAN
jgi:hypothetical protein